MQLPLVAAQEPETPQTPTTSINEVDNIVKVTWSAPATNGAPIIGYRVLIRESDLNTYSENAADCDGTVPAIIEARMCEMTVQKLMLDPWNLTPGTSIFAKIIAINIMGDSPESTGGNGAVLKLSVVPDQPINLARDDENTWAGQITLTWENGPSNGGQAVDYYRISHDQSTDSYVVVAD